jgi:hypothetical protein
MVLLSEASTTKSGMMSVPFARGTQANIEKESYTCYGSLVKVDQVSLEIHRRHQPSLRQLVGESAALDIHALAYLVQMAIPVALFSSPRRTSHTALISSPS